MNKATWSRGELDCLHRCPACCGDASISAEWVRADDLGRMPDIWNIHRCGKCESIYLNPRPDVKSLPAAYSDYLTHEADGSEAVLTSDGFGWALVRDYLKWRFGLNTSLTTVYGGRWIFAIFEPWRLKLDRFGRNLTKSFFPNAGRMLDVGCGAGDFMRLAIKMGWEAQGCDPDPEVVAICRSRGLDVRLGGAESFACQGEFDAITLNQVIEHVDLPGKVLRDCFNLLRPGGMLWLGFPNAAALGCSVFGEAWAGHHPPYHLCLPSQAIVQSWLATAGFERVTFLRRGPHARANWQKSSELAEAMNVDLPSRARLGLIRLVGDVLAVFTPRWGEETVVIAWKP